MKIIVRANWDDEAKVWYAIADNEIGLFIEGKTIEQLQEKIPVFLRDLFEGEYAGPFEIDLIATSSQLVPAE